MSPGDRLTARTGHGFAVIIATALAVGGSAAAPPTFGSVPARAPEPRETQPEVAGVRARAFLEQINTELGAGAWQVAAHHAEEAVAAAREDGDALLEAESLQVLGNALFHLERHQAALLAFQRALSLAEGQGDSQLEALLLKDLGITEKLLGEHDRAMLHLELATEREPDWRNGPMAVSILGNLGSLYQQLGGHQLALTTHEEALAVARRLGDVRGEIDCLARIGGLYLSVGQAERALEHIETALDLEVVGVSEGDASCRGWLLGMATEAYSRTGRSDAAIARSSEALPTGSDRARGRGGLRFMLDDYEISYAPSATVLAELQRLDRRRRKQQPADALVLANPEVTLGEPGGQAPTTMAERIWRLYQEDGFTLGPLPFSSTEAAVVAGYAGPDSAIHVGRQATEARIKGEELARFDILHFATHGLVTPAAAARSALVLAPGDPGEDGFLQAREIAKLRVHARLVVLSACRTAHGRQRPSEGVQSLARAFITAGASSVVCTLWDVDDAQAAQLIAAFYGHLGGGLGKAGALRAAKLECLRSSGRHGPPATWASFVLIGAASGVVPLKAPPDRRLGRAWLIVTALTAAAAALVVGAWVRRWGRTGLGS